MKSYKVNEIFYSLQGEGYHTGVPAVFVRFSGCNRRCDFCDTDFAAFNEMSAIAIIDAVHQCSSPSCSHVVLTGGEPAMQADRELVALLKADGYYVQIETNGTLPVPDNIDWITCSPKDDVCALSRVDELKLVYQGQDVEAVGARFMPKVKFLQPCSCANTAETIDYILKHPWWRLSLQTHKYTGIR